MNVTIRRGRPDDLQSVQTLSQALFHYELANGFHLDDSFDQTWPFSDAGVNYFTDRLSDSPRSIVFVATAGDRLVAFLAGEFDTYAYRTVNPIGELRNLYVDDAYRRQGIGARLIDTFLQWLQQHQVARVRVDAFTPNHAALALYRRMGFRDAELVLEKSLRNQPPID